MATIINNSELQKKIGRFSKDIEQTTFTVINRGKPRMVILPYFDNNEDMIEEYLEAYEISKNRKILQKELQESLHSGLSSLTI